MIYAECPLGAVELARKFADAFIHEIKGRIDGGDWNNTDTEWTSAVKEVLTQMGKQHGCAVQSSFGGSHEHLLDLVWYKSPDVNDIVLAVESEWGDRRAVWEDFEKLLQIKSHIKLMVWSTKNHDKEAGETVKGMELRYMKKFSQHIAGEEYILMEVNAPEMKIFTYRYSVDGDGPLSEFSFACANDAIALPETAL